MSELSDILLDGIIPADAGNTNVIIDEGGETRDHPRGCGEHSLCNRIIVWILGSSPRMRGTLDPIVYTYSVGGIIPADAGNTCSFYALSSVIADHPRGCGEHGMLDLITQASAGSSPRMRGTPD